MRFLAILVGLLVYIPLVAQEVVEIPGNQASDTAEFELPPSPVVHIDHGIILLPENYNNGLINNPLQLIQGRVGGMVIAKPGGDPNGQFVSRIRGIQSIGGSSEPLIVIDGLPDASLESIDPSDVESIQVIKDVGGTAIYGLRGGNGVILIETKKGNTGNSVGKYSSSLSFDWVDENLSYMSSGEYRHLISGTDFGSQTDWLEEVTRTGVSHVHNLSFSGDHGQTRYYTSFNYRKVGGIALNTGFERLNARVNVKQRFLNEKAAIGITMSVTGNDKQLGFGDIFAYSVSTNPTIPVYYDGSPGLEDFGGFSERFVFNHYNPVSIANQAVNDSKGSIFSGTLNGEFDLENIAKGMQISFILSTQSERKLYGKYFPSTLFYRDGWGRNGFAERTTTNIETRFTDTNIHYNREGEILSIQTTTGYTYQDFYEDEFSAVGGNFLSDAFKYNNLGAAQDFDNGQGFINSAASTYHLSAFYSQLNFDIAGTYFLNTSGRYEGSSRFGENKKWSFFPAITFSVRFDELLKTNMFTYLQGRISVGSSGRIPRSSNLSVQQYQVIGQTFFEGSFIPSYGIIYNENPDLGTERTAELSIGLDFRLKSGKLNGSFDWYNRNTKDMIMQAQTETPPNLGRYTYANIGQLRNHGIEFSLEWKVIDNSRFKYESSVLLGTYKTMVISLSSNKFPIAYNDRGIFRGYTTGPGHGGFPGIVRTKEGAELGEFWGPVFTGVSPDGFGEYADLNRDGTFCDYCPDDSKVIGNGLPDWTLGWSNSMLIGKFKLDLFFRGVFGHDLFNIFRVDYENQQAINVWNVVDTKYYDPRLEWASPSDLFVENAGYLTLDNLRISYSYENGQNKYIQALTIFITGQNLITFSGYTGIDPEVRIVDSTFENDPLAPGIERKNTYWPALRFSFGIQLEL